MITIKLAYLGHNSLIINISIRRTFFVIFLKISFFVHISENISISKIICPYVTKYSYIKEKDDIFEFTLKIVFANILKNICISSQRMFFFKAGGFCDHFENIVLCPYLRKYHHFEINNFDFIFMLIS